MGQVGGKRRLEAPFTAEEAMSFTPNEFPLETPHLVLAGTYSVLPPRLCCTACVLDVRSVFREILGDAITV